MAQPVRLSLSILALAVLAGCYNPRYPSDSPGSERREQAPVRSGSSGEPVMSSGSGASAIQRYNRGRVEAITQAAGAGDRVTVKLDDGTTHSSVQDKADLQVGDRVAITRDGRVARLGPSN